MAIYDSGTIDFVVDNRGRYWIIDPVSQTRYETGGPGSGSFAAARTLYGGPRNVDTMLTGWNEHAGGAVDFFGGPNEMERVIAGLKADPFTGYRVPDPQAITAGNGEVYTPPGMGGSDGGGGGTRWIPELGPGSSGPRPDGMDGSEFWGRDGTGSDDVFNRDAFVSTRRLLEEYGLTGLADDVREWLVQGLSQTEVIQRIRQSEQYAARFPGLAARRDAGLSPISEAQYIQLETSYRGILRRAELPQGFYDGTDDFTSFIANDISPAELESRVADGIIAARNAPAEVRDALADFYGVGNSWSALAAYYLDPEKGLEAIEREFRSAQIAGAADRSTWGSLQRQEAERLASLGVSGEQAQEGFGQLATGRQLMGALPGEVGSEDVTREEQIAAMFEGDADAQDEIRRQRERRVAAFSGAVAGSTSTREGVTGLRSS